MRIDKETSIEIVKEEHHQQMGKMSYFKWKLHSNNILKNLETTNTIRHCLLLPLLFQENEKKNNGIYTCIDSNWNELKRGGFAYSEGINENDLRAI